jgi:deazaflavin-dependent oxidoreductase (nitroreductase family)
MEELSPRKRSMANKRPSFFWKIIKYPPQFIYAIGLGPIYGRMVLLLTTTGRISGLPRITPLQYEEIDGKIIIGSARGVHADWFKNIQSDPNVRVRVRSRDFAGIGEPVTDPARIAEFLDYRLKKNPRMIGFIMSREGVSKNPSRQELEEHARKKAMVVITHADK